jgi:malonyl CoA-acyl carrier protein transacylase
MKTFPGQGAQFTGMGKDLYESSALAKDLFEKQTNIRIMFKMLMRQFCRLTIKIDCLGELFQHGC